MSLLKRLVGAQPWPQTVADRDWFHAPPDRFFRWFTEPALTTYMPTDEPEDYGESNFLKIQGVLAKGGFATFDLG